MAERQRMTRAVRCALVVEAVGIVLLGYGLFTDGHDTIKRVGYVLFLVGFVAFTIGLARRNAPRR